jgi:hypothetical protein
VPGGDERLPVGTHTHGQTFIASRHGLSGIRLLLATFGRPAAGTLVFRLFESADAGGPEVRSVETPCASIHDNEWREFPFSPLPGTAGRTFHFFLENPGGIPGTAPTVWANELVRPEGTTRFLMGRPVPGTLCFQALYAG